MHRLPGRAGKDHDEDWICSVAMEERRYGGLGPFSHQGEVRSIMYIIRSIENAKAIEEEQVAFRVLFESAKAGKRPLPVVPGAWAEARRGDWLVSRDLRAVYRVYPDGSRRRCADDEATQALAHVIKQLEEARRGDANESK